MKRIIQSDLFDIEVTASKNYKGVDNYVIRYGLETKVRETLEDAMQEFAYCLQHALACESLEINW